MNSFIRRGRNGLLAAATAAVLVIAPTMSANAATAVEPTVGSDKPLYLVSPEDGSLYPEGTSILWGAAVAAAPTPGDEEYDSPWIRPAGADQMRQFISPRGQERNINAWNAYASLGNPATNLIPDVSGFGNTTAGLGTPSGAAAVAIAGGKYSLGVAYIHQDTTTVVEVNYTYIEVTANSNPSLATYTWDVPEVQVPDSAPAITTQPASATVNPGASATFTAAADGKPVPSVQWQSNAGSGWADVAGATNASLTVSNTTLAQSGTQYRAVFTNTLGSVTTDAATLTVAPVAPSKPTTGESDIADPAKGAQSVTIPAGVAAAQTVQVWNWAGAAAQPANLGQAVVDADGNVVVDIHDLAKFPAGLNTVAFTLAGDSSFTVTSWTSFTKLSGTGDPLTDTADVVATVTASDLWALEATESVIDFGNVARNATATASLGKVTVIDDRNELKGWNLDATWGDFVKAGTTDTIAASNLTVAPKFFAGYNAIAGITVGSGAHIAESTPVSTLPSGALFDAALAFKAPVTAQAGEYHSTLTLTLTTK
ncbi:immunoglobulin domain-containing protein [Agromyces seonyuensis]|uniref:Ig-like domain-containing protein n=1 Tax=Agromyces seonyuensis TaxID=2662446 RepID=A0A6I4NUC0_9MICO|nr:immunoglobulin domain-containing protein [Agromyces seonyuensis]MWB97880.1 hypothetical protein [Agromyces seonyuensis]